MCSACGQSTCNSLRQPMCNSCGQPMCLSYGRPMCPPCAELMCSSCGQQTRKSWGRPMCNSCGRQWCCIASSFCCFCLRRFYAHCLSMGAIVIRSGYSVTFCCTRSSTSAIKTEHAAPCLHCRVFTPSIAFASVGLLYALQCLV